MADSKPLNKSIGTNITDAEMFRLFSDHLKTKTMCKHRVQKLPLITKYVRDQYKTQQMYDKVTLENGGMLMFISDCYKDQKCVMMLLITMFMH